VELNRGNSSFGTVKTANNSPQEESVNSPARSGCWVTVFGFPAAASSFILTHFSSYGTILETKTNPGSNWLHLRYSNKIEARKAVSKNGQILGGSIMVGVVFATIEDSGEPELIKPR